MTQKELMLRGYLYRADDPVLSMERMKVRKLIKKYNTSSPSHTKKRKKLLYKILGKRGIQCIIHPPFYCDYGYNIEVGENFFANYNCILLDVNKIIIGNNVMLAPGVIITTAGHPVHPEPRNSGKEYGKEIRIGNNVWIGANAIINPGITIGNNSVIGSGSVVTHDVPDNVIYAGNPAQLIKIITENDRQNYFKLKNLNPH